MDLEDFDPMLPRSYFKVIVQVGDAVSVRELSDLQVLRAMKPMPVMWSAAQEALREASYDNRKIEREKLRNRFKAEKERLKQIKALT